MSKKVLLCILDGWGLGKNHETNAIYQAKTPSFEVLKSRYGLIKLKASENYVLIHLKVGRLKKKIL